MQQEDSWKRSLYVAYPRERRRPFLDLLGLVQSTLRPRVLDLGCGTGELTRLAHETLFASETIGLERSEEMLGTPPKWPGLAFILGAIPEAIPDLKFDVILSNAALQWVPDHPVLFERLANALRPGGQLAIQMPWNAWTPYEDCALRVAEEFREELHGYVRRSPVLTPEAYVALLAKLGFREQRVGTWMYAQRHRNVDELVRFAEGGLLSGYRGRLSPEGFARFRARYEFQLREALGDGEVLFPFRRLFVWAQR